MKREKAGNLSIVLASLAVILIIFPAFGLFKDRPEAIVLAVIILLASSFFVKQLGNK